VRLAADPAPLVRACALAPETLVHRDLHHHNVALGDPEGAVVFDWEAVSAGPPVFDLALLHAYAPSQVLARATAGRLYVRRARALGFEPLLDRYLAALRAAAPRLDVGAARAAAPAAFAWEALHRLGWIDGQLDGLASGAALAARVPLLRRIEGRRPGPVMLGVWRELFAGLEGFAAALGVRA
jgi:aminoglycoside phosphotransferase (APT) family kinase protein